MRFLKPFIPSTVLLSVCAVSQAFAQYELQSSWILAEEGRAQQMFFGVKTLVGAELSFENIGNMPYVSDDDDSDYTFEFNDGYIDLYEDDVQFTTNFLFNYSNAIEDANGYVESFTLSRYRSNGLGASHTSDFDFAAGWELGSRYDMWKLSNRVTVGFTLAAGFTPLRYETSQTVDGELYRQTVTVPLDGPSVEYQESGYYVGGGMGGPYIDMGSFSFDDAFEERVSQILANGEEILVDSIVEGDYSLVGGMGTVRTGTYLDIYLTERLLIHLGIGISASYLSYNFAVDQSLETSTLAANYSTSSSIDHGEWLVGAYAEANLVYRLNSKTSVYAGAQAHFIQSLEENTVDDVVLDIRLGQPTQLQAGFEFDF